MDSVILFPGKCGREGGEGIDLGLRGMPRSGTLGSPSSRDFWLHGQEMWLWRAGFCHTICFGSKQQQIGNEKINLMYHLA